MNQPLGIELVTLETAPPNPRFDLVEDRPFAGDTIIATVYSADEDEAHKTAILFANAAMMYDLLRAIHAETQTRGTALNYDQWMREVEEIVRRIEEGA